MKKKASVILLIVAVLQLCVSITSFAHAFFFTTSTVGGPDRPAFRVSDDGSNTVVISTEAELVAQSRDTSGSGAGTLDNPSATNRITLKFANDLTLTRDLIVTADCHINLNGFSLNFNGHTLTVSHNYVGTFVIGSGVLLAKTQEDIIYINTPNAVVKTDVTVYRDGAVQQLSDYIKILGTDENWLAYSIFFDIAQRLADPKDNSVRQMTYAEIKRHFEDDTDGDSRPDNTNFENIHFLPEHASITGGEPLRCAYIYQDLDLPERYYGYAAEIEYNSSSSALSASGKVTTSQSVQMSVLTVTLKNQEGETFASKAFTLLIIDPTDGDAWAEIAKNSVLEYLSERKGSIDTDGDGEDDFSGYIIKGELQLPVALDPSAMLEYRTYDADKVLLDSTNDITGGVSPREHFRQTDPNTFILAVENEISYVRIIASSGTVSAATDYLPVKGDSSVVKDNYTIAQAVVRKWYGMSLTITNAEAGTPGAINGYTAKTLYTDVTEFERDGITGVSYSLVNNDNGVYEISGSGEDKLLNVGADKDPDQLLTVFLKISFEFGPDTVEITLPVVYDPDSGSGNSQLHPFLPYYTYFNKIFQTETGGNTYKSFEMPFNYSLSYPVVCFDIEGDTDGAISLSLYFNGAEHVLALGGYENYSEALDGFLSANSLALDDVLSYGDAKWLIKISAAKISSSDRRINMIYTYKFSGDAAEWTRYTTSPSSFILSGILRCDTTGIPDINLYTWVYNNFNPGSDRYNISADRDTKFVQTAWLSKDVTLDNTGNSIGISNYKGIDFLDGTKTLLLSGAGIDVDAVDCISGMEGLEKLDLSSNNLSDYNGTSWGFPSGGANNLLHTLSELNNLKILYLNGNQIFRFEGLLEFDSLTHVYTYANTFSHWLFGSIVNSIYGSSGSINIAVYQQLYQEKGVKVYYESPVSYYTGGAGATDYDKLKSIEYQNKLPRGVSIRKAYEHLSSVPSDYGITPPQDSHSAAINFSFTGSEYNADSFVMTYSYVFDPGYGEDEVTVEIKVTFSVTRVE